MKEEIIAEILNQPQQHAEKWATQLDHEGYESWIYSNVIWPPGKVKITIQSMEESKT